MLLECSAIINLSMHNISVSLNDIIHDIAGLIHYATLAIHNTEVATLTIALPLLHHFIVVALQNMGR